MKAELTAADISAYIAKGLEGEIQTIVARRLSEKIQQEIEAEVQKVVSFGVSKLVAGAANIQRNMIGDIVVSVIIQSKP